MAGENANQSFELPAQDQQEVEQAPDQRSEAVEDKKAVVETVGKAQESSTGKQPPQLLPKAQPSQAAPDDDQSTDTSAPTAPQSADDKAVAALPAKDSDLIEKEWVERAKAIIAKTVDDPHRQKDEVSKIKAAYIQKRFNKAVKTDEAAV